MGENGVSEGPVAARRSCRADQWRTLTPVYAPSGPEPGHGRTGEGVTERVAAVAALGDHAPRTSRRFLLPGRGRLRMAHGDNVSEARTHLGVDAAAVV